MSPARRGTLGFCILAAIIIAIYAPAFRGPFIWDDNLLITDNSSVTRRGGLPSIWEGSGSMDYTPLTLSSYWIEWRIWGGQPIGYHLANICLHIVSVFLIWRILEALRIPGAFLGAFLFAVHPVNAASVAWIAERKNTLSLMFYLLAAWWYLSFDTHRRRRDYLLALAAAACAFLSKGSTVVLPGVLLGCVWWRHGASRRRDLTALLPFIALAAATGLVTIHFQSQIVSGALARTTIPFRLIRAGDAVWFYLWKDLLPLNLCMIYPEWRIDSGSAISYLPLLLAAAAVAILWLRRGTWGRGPVFAAGYFLLTLLPVVGFLNMGFMEQTCVADWWQQLALIAPTAAAGACVAKLYGGTSGRIRTLISGVTVGAALLLAAATWNQAAGFESVDGFWTRILARNPDSWGAHGNFGRALRAEGKVDEAVAHYRRAIELNPGLAINYLNLGNALRAQGNPDLAVSTYQEAVRLNPDSVPALLGIGEVLQSQGKSEASATYFQRALAIDPNLSEVRWYLGAALLDGNNPEQALPYLDQAFRARPDRGPALAVLVNLLSAHHLYRQCARYYVESLARDPSAPDILDNYAWLLATCPDDGVRDGEKAVKLASKANQETGEANSSVLSTLAAAYAECGRFPEALATAQAALRLAESSSAPDKEVAQSAREEIVQFQRNQPYRAP